MIVFVLNASPFCNFTTQEKVARMIFMQFLFRMKFMRISYEIHGSHFSLCIHCFPFHIFVVQHRWPIRHGDQGDL